MGGIAILLTLIAIAFVISMITRKEAVAIQRRRPPCGSYGDVDGDGWVTEADAELVQRYVVRAASLSPSEFKRADVFGNGVVGTGNALFIKQYAVGLRDTFPVCKIM